MQAIRALTGNRWTDEYWTVVASVPVILAFVPGYDTFIIRGFESLDHAPDWFKALVAASSAFAFGRSAWRVYRSSAKPSPSSTTQGAT